MIRLIYLLILFVTGSLYAQSSQSLDCLQDSAYYSQLEGIIDDMAMGGNYVYRYHGDRLRRFVSKKDTLCAIRNYAIIFDKILNMGLDLSQRLPRAPNRNSRISLDTAQMNKWQHEYELAYNKAKKISGLYLLFVEVKDEYEQKFSYVEDSKYLKTEIDNLIRYGAWTHPLTVKDALKLRLRHFTRDKYYDDMDHSIKGNGER